LERGLLERGVRVAGINDLWDPGTLAHLLQNDTTFGRLRWDVDHDDADLHVGGQSIPTFREKDPANLRWGDLGVDLVIEATGKLRARDDAARAHAVVARTRRRSDLHELVIQRLFATGLHFQTAVRLAVRPEVVERIGSAVQRHQARRGARANTAAPSTFGQARPGGRLSSGACRCERRQWCSPSSFVASTAACVLRSKPSLASRLET